MAPATPRTRPTSTTSSSAIEPRRMVVAAGGQEHRLDLSTVREVATARRYTPLPGAPACVLGLANLRGSVVTVVDLAAALGRPAGEAPDGRVVVVYHGERAIGLAVDEVLGIERPDDGTPGGAPPLLGLAALLEPLFG